MRKRLVAMAAVLAVATVSAGARVKDDGPKTLNLASIPASAKCQFDCMEKALWGDRMLILHRHAYGKITLSIPYNTKTGEWAKFMPAIMSVDDFLVLDDWFYDALGLNDAPSGKVDIGGRLVFYSVDASGALILRVERMRQTDPLQRHLSTRK